MDVPDMDVIDAKEIPVIVGPTAIGKTALSIELAKRWGAEIVSADAIQIYEGLDIGSAKPTPEERQGIAHHMLSIVPVTCGDYSVAAYRAQATKCIDDILGRDKIPLVVGGTGLYVDALTRPMDFTEAADEALRERLRLEEARQSGSLHVRLSQTDATAAMRIHPNDIKRTIRALEVFTLTGRSITEHIEASKQLQAPYRVRMLGLNTGRDKLYERIELRVQAMMRAGFLHEVQSLHEAGAGAATRAMQGLGYKQLMAYLEGAWDLDTAVEAIIRETRRFAKRQLTWFRRDTRITWLDPMLYETPAALADAAQRYFDHREAP